MQSFVIYLGLFYQLPPYQATRPCFRRARWGTLHHLEWGAWGSGGHKGGSGGVCHDSGGVPRNERGGAVGHMRGRDTQRGALEGRGR